MNWLPNARASATAASAGRSRDGRGDALDLEAEGLLHDRRAQAVGRRPARRGAWPARAPGRAPWRPGARRAASSHGRGRLPLRPRKMAARSMPASLPRCAPPRWRSRPAAARARSRDRAARASARPAGDARRGEPDRRPARCGRRRARRWRCAPARRRAGDRRRARRSPSASPARQPAWAWASPHNTSAVARRSGARDGRCRSDRRTRESPEASLHLAEFGLERQALAAAAACDCDAS